MHFFSFKLTEYVDESVSDPGVHPAVDDGIEAGVREGQEVDRGEDVGEAPVEQNRRLDETQYLLTFQKMSVLVIEVTTYTIIMLPLCRGAQHTARGSV